MTDHVTLVDQSSPSFRICCVKGKPVDPLVCYCNCEDYWLFSVSFKGFDFFFFFRKDLVRWKTFYCYMTVVVAIYCMYCKKYFAHLLGWVSSNAVRFSFTILYLIAQWLCFCVYICSFPWVVQTTEDVMAESQFTPPAPTPLRLPISSYVGLECSTSFWYGLVGLRRLQNGKFFGSEIVWNALGSISNMVMMPKLQKKPTSLFFLIN